MHLVGPLIVFRRGSIGTLDMVNGAIGALVLILDGLVSGGGGGRHSSYSLFGRTFLLQSCKFHGFYLRYHFGVVFVVGC